MVLFSMEGMYGLLHILFLMLIISLTIGLSFYGYKINDNDKKLTLLMKILGAILFVSIVLNRIFVTKYNVEHIETDTWLMIFPNSFCSMASFILGLALIFGKKNNKILHFVIYLGLLGGVLTMFYPDFLESQKFWDPRSVTGLIHHGFLVVCANVAYFSKYFTPSMKNWASAPVGSGLVIVIGVFELDALHYRSAMQIHRPFVSSLPVLTSWYVVAFLFLCLHFAFLVYYEMIHNKKKFKNIFIN